MAQSLNQKITVTLNKGLITEAGELTFPEDATIDELNCILNRDGSRQRRSGINFEADNQYSSFSVNTNEVFTTGVWKNVGGVSNLDYLVVQVGRYLYFYDKTKEPLSAAQVLDETLSIFKVDILSYSVGNAEKHKCQFTSLNGILIVANQSMDTFYIEKNENGSFSVNRIKFKVRDFEWQSDIAKAYTFTIAAEITEERKYDTGNAGWDGDNGIDALNYFIANSSGRWPPLNLPWYTGKDAEGVFSVSRFSGTKSLYTGNTVTGIGHFILDFFNKDRKAVSGYDLPNEIETNRFSTVAAFQGRVFYSGVKSSKNGGKVLFSSLIQTNSELGNCYQQNDPTSEDFSDLLDTDGGVVNIPEAYNIIKLFTLADSLFVFAENGIWQIKGVDGVFRATEYSIGKVSSIGILTPEAFTDVEGIPFWWSSIGIHTLISDPSSGRTQEQNLTISTIQKFVNDISKSSKYNLVSEYDSVNKRIYWMYPDADEVNKNKRNNILVFDIALQAFYPWRVEDNLTASKYVIGTSFFSGISTKQETEVIITEAGDDVFTLTDDPVIVDYTANDYSTDTKIKFLVIDADNTNKLTVAEFRDLSFLDWGDTNYISFAESGFDFIGDLSTQKTAPYITVMLRRTEEGFVGDEINGYDYIRPSSLKVSAYWDFKSKSSTNPQQAYRLKKLPVINESNLNEFEYPKDVIQTRLKLRGKGKTIRFRFESEEGKDFQLLGYETIRGKNTRY